MERYEDQDLQQEKRLEIFKNELHEDLDGRFEKFRQEIKPGNKEARIVAGGKKQGILHLKGSCILYNSSHNSVNSFNTLHSLFLSPSLIGTGTSNKLAGASQMGPPRHWLDTQGPRRYRFRRRGPFPRTHRKPGLGTSPSCVLSHHNVYTSRSWMTCRPWYCHLLILLPSHPHSPYHALHADVFSLSHAPRPRESDGSFPPNFSCPAILAIKA